MRPKQIGILGFPRADALDISGPAEAFASVLRRDAQGRARRGYKISLIGLTSRPFLTEADLILQPTTTLRTAPKFDTIIIPGGAGVRDPKTNRALSAWLLQRNGVTRRLASVCTGVYALAATGLLDARRATTHWRFLADAAKKFPQVEFVRNVRFVRDGKFYSSGGVTSGIDLALALIEEDFGTRAAQAAAREMAFDRKRGA